MGIHAEPHTVYALDDDFWGEFVSEEEAVSAETAPSSIAPPSFPLSIAGGKNRVNKAQMLDLAGRILFNGVEYGSPSGAVKAIKGYYTSGWQYWHYHDPVTDQWVPIAAFQPK